MPKPKPRIVVTQPLPGGFVEKLKQDRRFVTTVYPHDYKPPRQELLRMIRGANAIITLLTMKVDAEFFDEAGRELKIVANYAVGFDNFDVEEARKRNIILTNTPCVLNDAVADHTMALMLGVMQRLAEADSFFRAGKYKEWRPTLLLGQELERKTLGLVGAGRIAWKVAKRAHGAFDMDILYYDINRDEAFEKEFRARKVSLETLMKESDIVSLHVPLNERTRHLIGAKELHLMKRTAILINTARGPVVDEKALVKVLKAERIFGAGLDVFEFEPKPAHGLTTCKNTILTPHLGSATIEARAQMAKAAVDNVVAVLTGKPPISPVETNIVCPI